MRTILLLTVALAFVSFAPPAQAVDSSHADSRIVAAMAAGAVASVERDHCATTYQCAFTWQNGQEYCYLNGENIYWEQCSAVCECQNDQCQWFVTCG